MTKEIKYDLEYREKGERKKLPLSIDFVSNWCIREFNKLMQIIFDIQSKWDDISDLNTEIAALKTEKPDGWKDQVAAKSKQVTEMSQAILAFDSEEIVHKRFDLLKQLLEDNGYKQEFLYDFNFWDKQVDPDMIIKFLTACTWKDIDKKKVQ